MSVPLQSSRHGRIVLPDRVVVGRVAFRDRIVAVEPGAGDDTNADLPWIVPGFIDVHVHGGGGGEAMDGPDGVRTLARTHLAHGTTSLLATTWTAPWEEVMHALHGVAEVARDDRVDQAAVLGAHLEGPFVHPGRLGAQPAHAQLPTDAKLREVLAADVVRVATLAPDVEGSLAAATVLARGGVRVSAGHTRASSESAAALFNAVHEAGGTAAATHLFNAMGGLEARAPGLAGATLATPEVYAELICDGHHVAPASVLTALRAKGDRLMLITDAIRATGTDATATTLGGRVARIDGGAVRLADGTLAGSVLTMHRAVRNLVGYGARWTEAVHAAATAPAHYLGLNDRGAIRPGLRADLVVLGPNDGVHEVFRGGVRVAGEGSS